MVPRVLSTGVLVSALSFGCASPDEPSPVPDPGLRGGVLATFAVGQEQFRVWMTNAAAVEQVLALQRGTSKAGIPNGRLVRGSGQASHNAPYSWHLDPQDIAMSEVTIELCDGRPSYVEAHLPEFVDTVGRYCPWGARLLDVRDYR